MRDTVDIHTIIYVCREEKIDKINRKKQFGEILQIYSTIMYVEKKKEGAISELKEKKEKQRE